MDSPRAHIPKAETCTTWCEPTGQEGSSCPFHASGGFSPL